MSNTDAQYAAAAQSGRRFIDQVRPFEPAAADFVQRKYLDIPYASGSDVRKLDVYLPNEGNGPYPVIIDIFGGGWYFGEKSSYKMNLALELLKHGYAVVSPGYSLSHTAKFPTQIYELKAAIRYVKNHAAEYHLDPGHIALLGESAGSHLGSIAACSTGAGVFEDIPLGETGDSSVNCMIALYCPCDLGATMAQFKAMNLATWVPEGGRADSPEGILLGATPADVPELVRMANPVTYLTRRSPAFQFFHGDDDRVVPYIQSIQFASKLIEMIGEEHVEHHLVKGAGHNQQHFMKPEIYEMMLNFLKKHI